MKSFLVIALLLISTLTYAQSVGVGTSSPDASAQLHINSINKGVLVPRMTEAQRDAIPSPATGLLIYQTNNNPGFYFFAGAIWVPLAWGGDFFLPYNGTNFQNTDAFVVSNTTGITGYNAIKGINAKDGGVGIHGTTTVVNGLGGYFNSGSGPALTTGAGNVGIGFVWAGNTSLGVDKARLVVRGSMGGTVAIFEDTSNGVSIEKAFPGIGFNTYKSGVRRFLSDGHGSAFIFDDNTGTLRYVNSSTAGTTGNTMTENTRVSILPNGNFGIGTTNPTRKLHVSGGLRVDTLAGGGNGLVQVNITGEASKLLYSGIATDVLRGDGTFGSVPGAGVSYWALNGTHIYNTNAGFVGIGTGGITPPEFPFTVYRNGQGVTQEDLTGTVKIGFFTNASAAYLQTYSAHDLNFATGNGATQMILTTAGNVGIGASTPALAGLVVDKKIGAVNALFGSNTTGVAIESNAPGIGLNSYFSSGRKAIGTGFGAGLSIDPATGLFSIFSSSASVTANAAMTVSPRLTIDAAGNIGVQGNNDPAFPLSFTNTTGNKIALWGTNVNQHYGLGIQGSLMQLYADNVGSDIAFGYGSSTSFTEAMRVKGNGNVGVGTTTPAEKLTVAGNTQTTGYLKVGNPATPDVNFAGQRKRLFNWDPVNYPYSENANEFSTTINCGTTAWQLVNTGDVMRFESDFTTSASGQSAYLLTPWIWIPASCTDVRAKFTMSQIINQTVGGVYHAGTYVSYTTDGTNFTKITNFATNGYNGSFVELTGCITAPATPGWVGFISDAPAETTALPIQGQWVRFRFFSSRTVAMNSGAAIFHVYNFSVSGTTSAALTGSFAQGNVYAEKNVYAGSNIMMGDVAEYFNVGEYTEPGDVISLMPGKTDEFTRSHKAYDENVIGIHSTAPTLTINSPAAGSPIALAGRVPVKVSNENGTITIGDYLTAASTPGYAMKADRNCFVIGKALESFSGTTGKITCLVQTGWQNLGNAKITGSNRIEKGQKKTMISLPAINDEARIFISFKTDPGSYYWINKTGNGSFEVILGNTAENDIQFDYMIESSPTRETKENKDPSAMNIKLPGTNNILPPARIN